MQYILICEDIPEEAYLLDMDFQLSALLNRIPTPKLPRRYKLWELTTSCQKPIGLSISLQRKAIMLKIIFTTRTIKVLLLCKIMGRL